MAQQISSIVAKQKASRKPKRKRGSGASASMASGGEESDLGDVTVPTDSGDFSANAANKELRAALDADVALDADSELRGTSAVAAASASTASATKAVVDEPAQVDNEQSVHRTEPPPPRQEDAERAADKASQGGEQQQRDAVADHTVVLAADKQQVPAMFDEPLDLPASFERANGQVPADVSVQDQRDSVVAPKKRRARKDKRRRGGGGSSASAARATKQAKTFDSLDGDNPASFEIAALALAEHRLANHKCWQRCSKEDQPQLVWQFYVKLRDGGQANLKITESHWEAVARWAASICETSVIDALLLAWPKDGDGTTDTAFDTIYFAIQPRTVADCTEETLRVMRAMMPHMTANTKELYEQRIEVLTTD